MTPTSPFLAGQPTVRDDTKTYKRLEVNYRRNKKQDHTALIDEAAATFDYDACRGEYWNPEELSLLHGTPIWDQASAAQRVLLNQLYWVAYYSQIISAEIATIYYNQASATALYAMEDFRLICDTLDLESAQERAHIAAFKTVSDQVEHALFGKRVFTYAMRGPFDETMVHADTDFFRRKWKSLQLRAGGLLSATNAFMGCQYFTIRGLRTLNGKLIQHGLGQYYARHPDQDAAPRPAAISYFHFQDESYHFNTSMLVAQEVVKSLPAPTCFEKAMVNLAIRGCQKDHYHFSAAVNGIFWYEPAVFPQIYEVLRSPHFGMEHDEALAAMEASFCRENDGVHRASETHRVAADSYKRFVEGMPYLDRTNRDMSVMSRSRLEDYLASNRAALARFRRTACPAA